MHNLALCYYNGEGPYTGFRKQQRRVIKSQCIVLPYVIKMQDFSKWTSKNKFIDKFIQEAQLSAKSSYEVLKWIPYNKLNNINYYDKRGFSEIYRAIWLNGPIDSWNFDEQQWNILKNLNNSSSLSDNLLDEWKHHYNFKFKWQTKLQLLKKIILGLKVIHESELTHCDFHDGNILISDDYNEIYIIDLGLCKPIQNSDDKIDKVYGIIPYMTPEILRNNPYTPACDIYKMMWEFEPNIVIIENTISEWLRCINKYYILNTNRVLTQEQANISVLQTHPQAYYTSHLLTEILYQNNSECLDCIIKV
ncbi:kinase-like domain-containing protein [Rhizophagus diaphanus]|nr:kinase-like domain-containing protein [Rhizophagus diaphanus] [Rhizophagus sp. MUCL 43196]